MSDDDPPTRFRAWLEEHDVNLHEASDLTGKSVSFLSRAARGERGVAPMTKLHIARCLGARVSDLFDVDEPARTS